MRYSLKQGEMLICIFNQPIRISNVRQKMKPGDAATYERARRLANLALWTSALQRRRLSSEEKEDAEFPFRTWMDFHFFIVALTRLRRAAVLASRVGALKTRMRLALSEFDAALPQLKTMRDVAEHIDDYAVDSGRNSTISRKDLEVASSSGDVWDWLGFTTNVEEAFAAAVHLFEALKAGAADVEKEPNKVPEVRELDHLLDAEAEPETDSEPAEHPAPRSKRKKPEKPS